MRKSAGLSGGLLSLLLAACQAPLCEELERAYAETARKSQPCLERAPLPAFEVTRCGRQLDACDAEDQARLEAQVGCYQRLTTCAPGQQDAFLEELSRCDANAPSNACEAAIFQALPGAGQAQSTPSAHRQAARRHEPSVKPPRENTP